MRERFSEGGWIYRDEWAKVIIVFKAYDIDVSGTRVRRRKRESYFGWMDTIQMCSCGLPVGEYLVCLITS